MITPLVPITILSIYKKNGVRVFLPQPFAQCIPDAQNSVLCIADEVKLKGGDFFLSDMFRTHDMQLQAHMDFVTGKKKAFSPPPGGSMHEAGRGIDIDLRSLKMPLADFWVIAEQNGFTPIIDVPDSRLSEAWHFDCRGSHQIVYDYYQSRKGTNIRVPYTAMAMSAILSCGLKVDVFEERQKDALIQSGLIRLGFEIGSMDGRIGPKTRKGLEDAGIDSTLSQAEIIEALRLLLEARFPQEYFPQQIAVEEDAVVPDAFL